MTPVEGHGAAALRVVVAVDVAEALAAGLERSGVQILACTAGAAPAQFADDRMPSLTDADLAAALTAADALVLQVDRLSLTAGLVGLCDRLGVRIVPLCSEPTGEALAAAFGLLAPLPLDAEPWLVADALAAAAGPVLRAPAGARRVIAVWGPAGAPGRSTLTVELAVELARGNRRVLLVDADSHAPTIALQLGLADEGPGFAAACRMAERGMLDAAEVARIALPLARTGVEVLTGINRPSRWPELSEARVAAALTVCRDAADYTIVDVAGSLERDEEIVSDLDGPRRNAATLAVLAAADLVVAVAGADPVGVARFLRAHADLRAAIGTTPVVVANRLRPGALGIDARGQVRRALERFAGIREVWFVPADARSADAALLAARPVAAIAPKSPLTLAVRRIVGEAIAASPDGGLRGILRSSSRRHEAA